MDLTQVYKIITGKLLIYNNLKPSISRATIKRANGTTLFMRFRACVDQNIAKLERENPDNLIL